jgi:hypothetical protein
MYDICMAISDININFKVFCKINFTGGRTEPLADRREGRKAKIEFSQAKPSFYDNFSRNMPDYSATSGEYLLK